MKRCIKFAMIIKRKIYYKLFVDGYMKIILYESVFLKMSLYIYSFSYDFNQCV